MRKEKLCDAFNQSFRHELFFGRRHCRAKTECICRRWSHGMTLWPPESGGENIPSPPLNVAPNPVSMYLSGWLLFLPVLHLESHPCKHVLLVCKQDRPWEACRTSCIAVSLSSSEPIKGLLMTSYPPLLFFTDNFRESHDGVECCPWFQLSMNGPQTVKNRLLRV